MTSRRFLVLMVAALVAIAGAMYLSSLRHLDRDSRGQAFLPGLEKQLDEVTDIGLKKGADKPFASLQRRAPGRWVLAERDGYPANLAKIRKLLQGLADAQIVEEKTSNPASYAILGVEDPLKPDAGGTAVTLTSTARTVTLIVGHTAGSGAYVRRSGEAQSFLVEPAVQLDTNTQDWIDSRLLDIPLEKIQAVHLRFGEGGGYTISRLPAAAAKPATAAAGAPPADEPGFALQAVPAGREPNEPSMIAPAASTFNGVPADDVAPAAGIDFSKPSVAELDLSDGSTLTISGVAAGDKHWITLKSSKDADLNARTQGRAFQMAAYRYDAIFRPVEQLLKPKPGKAAPLKPGASPKPLNRIGQLPKHSP